MHTFVDRHPKKYPGDHVNSDGLVWDVIFPPNFPKMSDKKYHASIADTRLNHLSFECCGYHVASADTIEELIEDIRSFHVPNYSSDSFLDNLRIKDKNNTYDDRQIELHWDGSGTKITRGKLTYANMTAYTSF